MALKRSSETIQIGADIDIDDTGVLFTKKVDLQLNVLDNEVFIVEAIDFEYSQEAIMAQGANVNLGATQKAGGIYSSISTTERTSVGSLTDSNVLAVQSLLFFPIDPAGAPPNGPGSMAVQTAGDTPPSTLNYIGIIATNDFYLNGRSLQLVGAPAVNGAVGSVSVRLYGYRARADAATYAALVQSELLSA